MYGFKKIYLLWPSSVASTMKLTKYMLQSKFCVPHISPPEHWIFKFYTPTPLFTEERHKSFDDPNLMSWCIKKNKFSYVRFLFNHPWVVQPPSLMWEFHWHLFIFLFIYPQCETELAYLISVDNLCLIIYSFQKNI